MGKDLGHCQRHGCIGTFVCSFHFSIDMVIDSINKTRAQSFYPSYKTIGHYLSAFVNALLYINSTEYLVIIFTLILQYIKDNHMLELFKG